MLFGSKNKLRPAWNFVANGVIWRLLISQNGYLVGEDRNKESKMVTFFCIHLESGEVLWQGKLFDEDWWMGLEARHNDIVFMHEFATPDLPEHKKIPAVDMMTGRPLWTNEQSKFLFAHEDRVYTVKDGFETRTFIELDLRTGKEMREVDTAVVNELRNSARPDHPVQLPVTVESVNVTVAGV